MATKHGKATELWLDAVDVSQYFNDLGVDISVDTAETSTFKGTFKTYIEGVASSKVSAKGFYDLNNDAALATILRNGGSVLTTFPAGAVAIGDLARLVSVHETDLAESSPVGGAVVMSFAAIASGIVGFGQALHILSTDTNTTTGAGKDDTAATSLGWIAHLHVISVTGGSWVIKLQDSTVDSGYADVTGGAFTAATTATQQRLVSAAHTTQLRRWVKYVATRTGGVGGDSITFGLAYSRNG
jgi:hypothetical protein